MKQTFHVDVRQAVESNPLIKTKIWRIVFMIHILSGLSACLINGGN